MVPVRYSYIGAPWVQRQFSILKNSISKHLFNKNLKHDIQRHTLGPVGNGGLSLRNISDCITILNKKITLKEIIMHSPWLAKHWTLANLCRLYWAYLTKRPRNIGKLFRAITMHSSIHRTRAEDVFFRLLSHMHPSFTTPTPEQAASFAVENITLQAFLPPNKPFGAHGKHFFEKTEESMAFYRRYKVEAPFD